MAYRISVICVSFCALSASMFVASNVEAGVIGSRWEEIDNSTSSATGAATGLNDGTFDGTIYRTFDLYLQVTSDVLVLDSGVTQSAGPNSGLLISGSDYFQFAGAGVNNVTPLSAFFSLFPLLEYDSYVSIGDIPGSQIGQIGLTFDTNDLVGTWFAPGSSPGTPDAAGEIFVGRFTVESVEGFGEDESDVRTLGGQLFVGLSDNSTTVVNISNAFATTVIPTPGAMPIAALMGLAALRRRRN
jgi:uncharacterized protein (TIGR03382 family)